MIKFTAIVWRKPELTPEEFTRHWKDVHGPLVSRHARLFKMRRYTQTHRVPSELVDQAVREQRGWLPPPDGLAIAEWDSMEDMLSGMEGDVAAAASKEIVADEARFLDFKKMSAFLAEDLVFDFPAS